MAGTKVASGVLYFELIGSAVLPTGVVFMTLLLHISMGDAMFIRLG